MTTTTEQTIREPIDLDQLLERGLALSDYRAKKQRFLKHNQEESSLKKGIGIAAFLHGAGFTGSGERYLASVVGVEVDADGGVRVLVSSTEFGQGTKTVLSQIAAEALGLSYEDVEVAQADTGEVPNSGPTVASRTVMVVGKLVESAAHGLKQTLIASGLGESYSRTEFREACAKYIATHAALKSLARYEAPSNIFWDDEKYRGEAYAAFAWAIYIAEVTVDTTTYGVTVDDFVALQEVGRVLHPVLARGQITGGVAQGIGYTLYEKVVWQDGRMQNGQMTNYIMPTSADLPPIRVYFEELGNVHGAFGAKGIGELPMDGPAPAIVNAVADALGTDFDSIPLLPEDIFSTMTARQNGNPVHAGPQGVR